MANKAETEVFSYPSHLEPGFQEDMGHAERTRDFLETYKDQLTKLNPDKWVGVNGDHVVAVADTYNDIYEQLNQRGVDLRRTRVSQLSTVKITQIPG